MGIPDPAGSLMRGAPYAGRFVPATGATSATIKVPGSAGASFAIAFAVPSWNSVVYAADITTGTFTLQFNVPCPTGGYVNFIAFVMN